MKQGSTDDPFAEDTVSETGTDTDTESRESATNDPETESSQDATTGGAAEESSAPGTDDDNGSEASRLPYIYARDSVKDGRQQRPIFLRDEIEDGIPELVGELEDRFGENVYRTDVMEAAVEVAQEHPDLLEAKLEEWGYGWD
ncbi:hypothetical protein [Halorientalis regularis]|uniref:Uncharacterized protein n=1 Tax=Halorientalis regularis TaxID=660518 RepID=A0A1G7T9F8_9EURY|nr:hypothetical protein [Halorientalis regularis]SDG31240.1 hypothetical protein SAMN05216218_12336 [Halorientalis regularis]